MATTAASTANLASDLIRTVARAFYPVEHILVIDALTIHSTLSDSDLAHILSLQPKALRKLCGRLKDDGLLSIQTRAERRTDGSGGFYGAGGQTMFGKERLTNKDWYYLNHHRAIDSIKYRVHKLHKHIEARGAPTTEKKDLACPQCKAQWTHMEVLDRVDFRTGSFMCVRCGHTLDEVEEAERTAENEGMKRLNDQLEKVLRLMQRLDAENVAENDFETALAKQKPIVRGEANPGPLRTETLDLPSRWGLQSSKGLDVGREQVRVELKGDEEVKKAEAEAEAKERREREAKQNALPDWIAKSTVSGEITAVGAKEERERLGRGLPDSSDGVKAEENGDEKKVAIGGGGEEEMMASYWAEMAKAAAVEQAQNDEEEEEEEEDDDDDDGDDFEDVGMATPTATATPSDPAPSTAKRPAPAPAAAGESSNNTTDSERQAKRPRLRAASSSSSSAPLAMLNGDRKSGDEPENAGPAEDAAKAPATAAVVLEDTPAASEEDEEEEGLEFENV
ncbi:hypothetical protein B0A50_06109 [Salinomyces thailandicus]|uniref:HTH TFE/IIEalpha-type domain-containing protein n=1 Tax=Salinomyces thailandicus TaxID=706561 RepID=A0A4U0TT89_9PEZI|nr:hypothetical protein B0A50_06109 [Salinomyces thailandica]